MLNNLTNFFNLIRGKRIKQQLEPGDLIAVGTQVSRRVGDYKPTAIQYKELATQISNDGWISYEVQISADRFKTIGSTPYVFTELINVPGKYYKLRNIELILEGIKNSFNFLNSDQFLFSADGLVATNSVAVLNINTNASNINIIQLDASNISFTPVGVGIFFGIFKAGFTLPGNDATTGTKNVIVRFQYRLNDLPVFV